VFLYQSAAKQPAHGFVVAEDSGLSSASQLNQGSLTDPGTAGAGQLRQPAGGTGNGVEEQPRFSTARSDVSQDSFSRFSLGQARQARLLYARGGVPSHSPETGVSANSAGAVGVSSGMGGAGSVLRQSELAGVLDDGDSDSEHAALNGHGHRGTRPALNGIADTQRERTSDDEGDDNDAASTRASMPADRPSLHVHTTSQDSTSEYNPSRHAAVTPALSTPGNAVTAGTEPSVTGPNVLAPVPSVRFNTSLNLAALRGMQARTLRYLASLTASHVCAMKPSSLPLSDSDPVARHQ